MEQDIFSWFDEYDGPKFLLADSSGATCWVGLNCYVEQGGVTGRTLEAKAKTLFEALAELRRLYDSAIDRLANNAKTPSIQ